MSAEIGSITAPTTKRRTNFDRLTPEEEKDLLDKAVEYRRLNELEKDLALKNKNSLPLLSVRAKHAGYGEDLDGYEDAKFEGQLARETLVTHNMGLVHHCINKIIGKETSFSNGSKSNQQFDRKKGLPLNSLSREDLVQEGAIGLARAVDKWNPEIGGKFSTYAVYWVRAAILRCIAERDDVVRVPNHVSQAVNQINKAAKRLGWVLQESGGILVTDQAGNAAMSGNPNSPQWEAANAAKKAAEASSLAKAAAAMDAIFSADGGQMTQILATCLTDPKYEIRVDRKVALPSPSPVDDDRQMEDENSPNAPDHRYATVSTTHVYLYIDGTSYYRLNLTPPFWDASPAIQVMPQPKLYVEGQAQFLDSLFFFGIIGAFVFGMVVLLHNIGVLRIDPRLKFKSFFHPPHPGPAGGTRGGYMNATQVRESGGYRDEVDVDSDSCFTDEASDAADWTNGPDDVPPERKGGGQAHPFNNPSAIPSIFMGRVSSSQNLQVGASAAAAGDSWEGDFELSDMKGTDSRQGSESRRSSSNRSGGDLDFGKPGAMGSRIDNMKAAMDDDNNDDDGAGKTPNGRGRSRSLRRDDPNRSVHSASSSSNRRRRRSPVESVPLPAQVRASRDPEFVDLPGLKSLTPVAIPQGVSRQLSRANSSVSKSKRSLSGEMLQESTVESGNENGDGGGSAHRSTPLAIV